MKTILSGLLLLAGSLLGATAIVVTGPVPAGIAAASITVGTNWGSAHGVGGTIACGTQTMTVPSGNVGSVDIVTSIGPVNSEVPKYNLNAAGFSNTGASITIACGAGPTTCTLNLEMTSATTSSHYAFTVTDHTTGAGIGSCDVQNP